MHNCPKCNKASRCDIEDGRSVCWCFSAPALPVDANVTITDLPRCLCQTCLHEAAEAAQAAGRPSATAVKERPY